MEPANLIGEPGPDAVFEVRTFAFERCAVDQMLVVPVRLLFKHYLRWCSDDLREPLDAWTFALAVSYLEGVTIMERTSGVYRRMAVGIAPCWTMVVPRSGARW